MRKFLSFIFVVLFLVGCSTKSSDSLYNLPPMAWYDQIMEDIRTADFDAAKVHYTQFASEHIASPLLEPTLMILAMASADDNNYIDANEYLNEYIRKFGTRDKIEHAIFLKIKANYDSFQNANRNQILMQNSIIEINNFLIEYPKTQYRPLVETMLIKFKLSEFYLDQNIINLYNQTGRPESAEFYQEKIDNSALKDANLIPPDLPWYRKFFE
ncbi:MAG: outer membrane protein assembly factor BamD [Campylobacter sp.]|nr:outer membrane protein assembly factor BamD [Campylobacter sp.]